MVHCLACWYSSVMLTNPSTAQAAKRPRPRIIGSTSYSVLSPGYAARLPNGHTRKMEAKHDVDAIWRQLKQGQPSKATKARLESLWQHTSCSHSQQRSSKAPPKQLQQQLNSSSAQAGASCSNRGGAAGYDALRSGLQDGSAVPQLTLALQSLDGAAVKAALQQLQVCLWWHCAWLSLK